MKKTRLVTNPDGSNQWVPDPRQQLFLAYYKDPKSPTFSNALQSALRAGYAQRYAENIMDTLPDWLRESVGTTSPALIRAEKNLLEFLELPNETQAMSMYGPIFETKKTKVQDGFYKNGKPKFKIVKEKKPVMNLNPKVMKIKQDTSHFIAETVGKMKYSKKDSGGNTFNFVFLNDEQRERLAKRIIARRGSRTDARSEGTSY